MKQFVKRVLLFCIIIAASYLLFSTFVTPRLLTLAFGDNVENQLKKSFKMAKELDYELLILGNSKIYCGVNPDMFSRPTYNLAHNNDNYNQLYYKLIWLKEQGKSFDYLILGTDYFKFGFKSDTRNAYYGKYLGKQYLKDYNNSFFRKAQLLKEEYSIQKLKKLLRFPYEKHYLKDNGQFARFGKPSDEDFQKRKFGFMDLQIKYFDSIIAFANREQIKVYILMPPMQNIEFEQYQPSEIDSFNRFINSRLSENVAYLDFGTKHAFGPQDYIDMAHLNQDAANVFSKMLDSAIFRPSRIPTNAPK